MDVQVREVARERVGTNESEIPAAGGAGYQAD
jgi:hypothetical protein